MDRDPSAKGYALLGVGHGAILMANVFLSSSLIFLASKEAGCVDVEMDEIIADCDNTIRGFSPAAIVTNIAIVTGLLGAFFIPVIGAIIDYTEYRLAVGIFTAVLFDSNASRSDFYGYRTLGFPWLFYRPL